MHSQSRKGASVLALALSLMACGSDARPRAAQALTPSDQARAAAESAVRERVPMPASVSNSVARFGSALYQRAKPAAGNFALSPFSLAVALGMTERGANGQTREEMLRVLNISAAEEEQALRALGSYVAEASQGPIALRSANQLFLEATYRLEDSYTQSVRELFGLPIEPKDFRRSAERVRDEINQWVSSQTENKIPEILPTRSINELTRLVLVNALYYRANWSHRFDPNRTSPQPFFTGAEEGTIGAQSVPTMRAAFEAKSGQVEGARVLELPYEGERFAMLFFVPEDWNAFEAGFSEQVLQRAVSSLHEAQLDIFLPKFRVEGAPISSKESLRTLGMIQAFDSDHADFSRMTRPSNPDDALVVADVFHRVFVEVDERGTEAAAASAVVMRPRGGPPPRPPEFRVDRPFLFVLRDTQNGMPLFIGRVVRPVG